MKKILFLCYICVSVLCFSVTFSKSLSYFGYVVPKGFENILHNQQIIAQLKFNGKQLGNIRIHITNHRIHFDHPKYIAFLISENNNVNRIALEQQLQLPIVLYSNIKQINILNLKRHPVIGYYNPINNTLSIGISPTLFYNENIKSVVSPPKDLSAVIQNSFDIYSTSNPENTEKIIQFPLLQYYHTSYIGWSKNYTHHTSNLQYNSSTQEWEYRIFNLSYNHIFTTHGTELGLLSSTNNVHYLQSLVNFTFETDAPMYGITFGTWGPFMHDAVQSSPPVYIINNGEINSITITTLDGQILSTLSAISLGLITIDTSNWPVGSYNIKIIRNRGQANEITNIQRFTNYYHGLLNNKVTLYSIATGYSGVYKNAESILPKFDIPFVKLDIHKSFTQVDMQTFLNISNKDLIVDTVWGYYTNNVIPFVEGGTSLYGAGLNTGVNFNIKNYGINLLAGHILTYDKNKIAQYTSIDSFTTPKWFGETTFSATFVNHIITLFYNLEYYTDDYLAYLDSIQSQQSVTLYNAGFSYIYTINISKKTRLSTSLSGSLSNNNNKTILFNMGLLFNTSSHTSWYISGNQSLLHPFKTHSASLQYQHYRTTYGLNYKHDEENNTQYTLNTTHSNQNFSLSGDGNFNTPNNTITYTGHLFSTLGISSHGHTAWSSLPLTSGIIIDLTSIDKKSKASVETKKSTKILKGDQNFLYPTPDFLNTIIRIRPLISNFEVGNVGILGTGYFPGTVTYIPFKAHSIRIVIGKLVNKQHKPIPQFSINHMPQTQGTFQVNISTTTKILKVTQNNKLLCRIIIPVIPQPNILFLGTRMCHNKDINFIYLPTNKSSYLNITKKKNYIKLNKNNVLILQNSTP